MAADKIYTKKINPNKIWDFSSMRLGNKWARKEQKGQSLVIHCFFKKRIKLELTRNIAHQKKSMRESFITLENYNCGVQFFKS